VLETRARWYLRTLHIIKQSTQKWSGCWANLQQSKASCFTVSSPCVVRCLLRGNRQTRRDHQIGAFGSPWDLGLAGEQHNYMNWNWARQTTSIFQAPYDVNIEECCSGQCCLRATSEAAAKVNNSTVTRFGEPISSTLPLSLQGHKLTTNRRPVSFTWDPQTIACCRQRWTGSTTHEISTVTLDHPTTRILAQIPNPCPNRGSPGVERAKVWRQENKIKRIPTVHKVEIRASRPVSVF